MAERRNDPGGKRGIWAQGECVFIEGHEGAFACDEYRRRMSQARIPVITHRPDALRVREVSEERTAAQAEAAAREALRQAATAIEGLLNHRKWRDGDPSTNRALATKAGGDALAASNRALYGSRDAADAFVERLRRAEEQRDGRGAEAMALLELLLGAVGSLQRVAHPHVSREACRKEAEEFLEKIGKDPDEIAAPRARALLGRRRRTESAISRLEAALPAAPGADAEADAAFVGLAKRVLRWLSG